MGDWREGEGAPRDWSDLKLKALLGGGFAVVVLLWMVFARPGDEAPSARGFNLGSAGGAPSRSTGRPFATRAPKTSLDMVSAEIGSGPPGVMRNNLLVAPEDQAESADRVAARELPATPPPAEQAAAAPVPAVDETKELAAAGIPTDANGLNRLGTKAGLLSALAAKMLDHPKVLTAIFNNKRVVDAFMNRDISKRNCQSGGALKSYLSDPSSAGMTKVYPVLQQALSRPATASALAGTEMAKRVLDCPSINALSKDPSAIMSVAMSNTKALGVLSDPRVATALASNPKASGMLTSVTSSLGK